MVSAEIENLRFYNHNTKVDDHVPPGSITTFQVTLEDASTGAILRKQELYFRKPITINSEDALRDVSIDIGAYIAAYVMIVARP